MPRQEVEDALSALTALEASCETFAIVEAKASATYTLKQLRVGAALRAAVYSEPLDLERLRLAVAQAYDADVQAHDLGRAEELIRQEESKERLLDELRSVCAAGNIGAIVSTVNRHRGPEGDLRKILAAVSRLIEEEAKVARTRGISGFGAVVLGTLEQERRDLHNRVQELHGGLRVVCRVRPPLPEEMAALDVDPSASPHCDLSSLGVTCLDKHTISVRSHHGNQAFRVGAAFGPDCIQAEVWSEMRGLVQSAVDGYNISVITCGPRRGGKTFTMLGGGSEGRGLMPRTIDELFDIGARDSWRAALEVDAQLFEISDGRTLVDLLAGATGGCNITPPQKPPSQQNRRPSFKDKPAAVRPSSCARPAAREAWTSASSSSAGSNAQRCLGGLATRRISDRHELRRLVEQAWQHPLHPELPRHVGLSLNITRTNQSTGAASKSRLVLLDLAGIGHSAAEDVGDTYAALQEVLEALAMQKRRVPWSRHPSTEVLQDCMGGNAKTLLLLALSPNPADAEDALAGIAFASCGSW